MMIIDYSFDSISSQIDLVCHVAAEYHVMAMTKSWQELVGVGWSWLGLVGNGWQC